MLQVISVVVEELTVADLKEALPDSSAISPNKINNRKRSHEQR